MKKLIPALIRLLVRYYSSVTDPRQRRVNDKITRNFHLWIAEKGFCNPDATLSNVAEEFGVSEEDLSYFFATVVGNRFSSVRKDLRMEEARRLICDNPDEKIINVANRVGILDKCNFRKQFHEKYGIPPSEWRKQCSEEKSRR